MRNSEHVGFVIELKQKSWHRGVHSYVQNFSSAADILYNIAEMNSVYPILSHFTSFVFLFWKGMACTKHNGMLSINTTERQISLSTRRIKWC